jgi:GT2 family glycosyltransferase
MASSRTWRTPDRPLDPLSQAEMPAVTVIVCTVGRERRLRDCVLSVLGQSYPRLTLLVVDNAPGTGDVQGLLAGIDDPRLSMVAEPRRGLSFARNTGLAAACGDIVAFTDDDAVPDKEWITALVRVFAVAGPAVTCVTGRVLAASLDTRWERLFEQFGGFDKGARPLVWSGSTPCPAAAELGEPGPRGVLYPYGGGEFGSGNNMSFRRSRLLELGGFDTALGAGSPARGGEDLDAFRAVLLAGDTIAYTPLSIVSHHHRNTAAGLRSQLFGYGTGMAAVITKVALTDPDAKRTLVARAPAAFHMLLSSRSAKNAAKLDDYPLRLTAIELAGYLAGPWLLLRSRRRVRRLRRLASSPFVPDARLLRHGS